MGLLADHEGVWELHRLGPAIALAAALVAAAAATVTLVWRNTTRVGRTLAAFGAVGVAIGAAAGVLPIEADNGNNICGPILHLRRADSSACDGTLSSLSVGVFIALSVGLASFIAAAMVCSREGEAAP